MKTAIIFVIPTFIGCTLILGLSGYKMLDGHGFNFLTQIIRDDEVVATGFFVSHNVVVTAAHIFYELITKARLLHLNIETYSTLFTIKIGEIRMCNEKDRYTISQVAINSEYIGRDSEDPSDIAFLTIEKTPNNHKILNVAERGGLTDIPLEILGMSSYDENLKQGRSIEVPYVYTDAQKKDNELIYIPERPKINAKPDLNYAVPGDDGGPLVYKDSNSYTAIGIYIDTRSTDEKIPFMVILKFNRFVNAFREFARVTVRKGHGKAPLLHPNLEFTEMYETSEAISTNKWLLFKEYSYEGGKDENYVSAIQRQDSKSVEISNIKQQCLKNPHSCDRTGCKECGLDVDRRWRQKDAPIVSVKTWEENNAIGFFISKNHVITVASIFAKIASHPLPKEFGLVTIYGSNEQKRIIDVYISTNYLDGTDNTHDIAILKLETNNIYWLNPTAMPFQSDAKMDTLTLLHQKHVKTLRLYTYTFEQVIQSLSRHTSYFYNALCAPKELLVSSTFGAPIYEANKVFGIYTALRESCANCYQMKILKLDRFRDVFSHFTKVKFDGPENPPLNDATKDAQVPVTSYKSGQELIDEKKDSPVL